MSSKIGQLQLLQQNLQNILMQKQQIQEQLTELDSALQELNNTEKAYKIIGKLMITSSKEDLSKDLQQKKEVAEIRLKNFASQEEQMKKSVDETQKEIMEEMKKEKDGKNN